MENIFQNKINKYKSKYLELKQKVYLKDEFIYKLKQLYPRVVFDKNNKDINENNDKRINYTYGEMEYDGIKILLDHIKNTFNIDKGIRFFYDIGSGRGKLPIIIACLDSIIKSIGIEIVEERHNDALQLLDSLKDKYDFLSKVNLINNDFNKLNLYEEISNEYNLVSDDNNIFILIWISNLCFNSELNDELFIKLITEFPKNTIICCSKAPSKTISIENKTLINKGTIQTIMSWNRNSDVHIYIIE